MELLQGLSSRRSVRGFKSTPVPEEALRAILQAAIRSPSYTNTQPWEVAVVSGRKRDALSQILYDLASAGTPSSADVPAPTQWPPALAGRAAEHSARRFRVLGIERDDADGRNQLRLQNYRFFGAPCIIFLFLDSTLGDWSTFDLGLFAQTLALAAHGLGLGTCLQASVTHYPVAVRSFLDLPPSKKLVLGISLGYPDPAAPINRYESARAGLDEIVKWYR
ncbi:MAG: nitroreductase [Rhodoferax sp.]|uniref:nitroreductase n=1 Tax=Rhodoferax sp. TaxID=50421 RepID=UPI00262CC72A|nr:nitroreductase [Rhodoferax sp.]MDD5334342.1 nitroreductase [Rhodoferax sp.]